jgi:hypothetical protein
MKNKLELQNKSFEIFENGGNYINQTRMYFAYFNAIPNIKTVDEIDERELIKWIKSEYKEDIISVKYQEKCSKTKRGFNDLFFFLNNKILINIFSDNFYVLFNEMQEEIAELMIQKAITFVKKRNRTKEISLVITTKRGLDTKEIEIKKPQLTIDLHYNDDFKNVHQIVLKTLKQKKQKGLFLFHGLPGTGKSTYIKYLIHQQNKKVIFISPKMAGSLDSTDFTEFLIHNENSILVIEDAEDLITSRENNQNSHLSFLLNLTDGILADSLGIQIIATFNTNIKNIDKALLRKGRLTAIYEFKELEFQKVNALFEHLKIEHQETFKPMTLTNIFNFKETSFEVKKEKVRIGF